MRLLHVGLQSLDIVEKQEFKSKQVSLDLCIKDLLHFCQNILGQ